VGEEAGVGLGGSGVGVGGRGVGVGGTGVGVSGTGVGVSGRGVGVGGRGVSVADASPSWLEISLLPLVREGGESSLYLFPSGGWATCEFCAV
jgi:hypothetical protein